MSFYEYIMVNDNQCQWVLKKKASLFGDAFPAYDITNIFGHWQVEGLTELDYPGGRPLPQVFFQGLQIQITGYHRRQLID